MLIETSNEVVAALRCSAALFDKFDLVYLFGSSVFSLIPSDIDLVLVYSTLSIEAVQTELDRIDLVLTPLLGAPIHFTALSESEFAEATPLRGEAAVRLKP